MNDARNHARGPYVAAMEAGNESDIHIGAWRYLRLWCDR
jgi:hypothetical protein